MSLFVGFSQTGRADVRVDLSRHETLVAEQLLNAAYIGTAIEQMRGKTMT